MTTTTAKKAAAPPPVVTPLAFTPTQVLNAARYFGVGEAAIRAVDGFTATRAARFLGKSVEEMVRFLSFTAPPGAPVSVLATPGAAGTASVSFVPPTVIGGSAITGYTVQTIGGAQTISGAGSPLVITGVPAGQQSFRAFATNTNGAGDLSVPSPPVTIT